MTIRVELTDAYGGEANYSWVRKAKLELPDDASDRSIITRAKRAVHMDGTRHNKRDYGDMIELRFPHTCVVMFIYKY